MNNESKTEETKFCRLCGKHRPVDEFMMIPLCRLPSNGIASVEGCKAWNVVVFNIRTIVGEMEKDDMKRLQEAAAKMPRPEGENLIVVPQLRVPKNLRS